MVDILYTEGERLNSVDRFKDFNFDLNSSLDGILRLATEVYQTPVAFITLIDEHEQLFVANRGFEVTRMPRATSFCTEVIKKYDVMVVSDVFADERFVNNPLVVNAPNIRFYAGAPLSTQEGHNIGTLCVMDVMQKEVSDDKKQLIDVLARQAIHLMELERTYKILNEKMQQVERQNKALKDIAFIQSHEFRGPLSTIMGLMNIIKDEDYTSPKENLIVMEEYIAKLDQKIVKVVQSTEVAKSLCIA